MSTSIQLATSHNDNSIDFDFYWNWLECGTCDRHGSGIPEITASDVKHAFYILDVRTNYRHSSYSYINILRSRYSMRGVRILHQLTGTNIFYMKVAEPELLIRKYVSMLPRPFQLKHYMFVHGDGQVNECNIWKFSLFCALKVERIFKS